MKKLSKRIHVVTRYFYPVSQDMENMMLDLYSNFVKEGWDVIVHTSNDTLSHKRFLSPRKLYNGITIRRYKSHFWGFIPRIKWHKADIVVLHGKNPAANIYVLMSTFMKELTGKKKYALIISLHKTVTRSVMIINQVADAVLADIEEVKGLIKMGVRHDKITVMNNAELYTQIETLFTDLMNTVRGKPSYSQKKNVINSGSFWKSIQMAGRKN